MNNLQAMKDLLREVEGQVCFHDPLRCGSTPMAVRLERASRTSTEHCVLPLQQLASMHLLQQCDLASHLHVVKHVHQLHAWPQLSSC